MIRINLGSGTRPLDGWVNVDAVALAGVDVVHNLDVAPWPFKDGSASEIRAEDVFEHVADPLVFMAQCWRILVPGGHLRMRTSYWRSMSAYTDPTHRRFCTELTWDYWCVGTEYFERYGTAYSRGCQFEKAEVRLDNQELVVHLIRRGGPQLDRKEADQVEWEHPRDSWDLCRARYEEALEKVEAHLRGGRQLTDAEVVNEMRIIRMATMRKSPWWDRAIDPEDNSVTVGTMMRNAFEAVGDWIDGPLGNGPETMARHWFTKRYLPFWRRGKAEYNEWLDALGQERPPE